jgi:excisionase family DNA binding protein
MGSNSGNPAYISVRDPAQSTPPKTRPLKRLYSIPEAAVYLGRSTWSIRRLIWSGALPSVRAGGRVHLDLHDLDNFIERNKVIEEA